MELRPIGAVRSSIIEPIHEGWEAVECRIELDPMLAPGLLGIEEYSHVLVLFWLNRVSFEPGRDLQRRPRDRADLPVTGVFATRTQFRPNPIGATVARLLGVEANVLSVKGLDAIDGTPVLDIKPYVPAFDEAEGARYPEWVGHTGAPEARREEIE